MVCRRCKYLVFTSFILLFFILTHKAPNTRVAEFSNNVDPDETDEPSHLDLQCLPSSL